MKKILTFVLLFILVINNINSQNIKWGEISESKSMFYSPEILGQDENFAYSLSFEKDEQFIEKFDKKSFQKLYSVKIERPIIEGEESEFERIDLIADKFIIFSSIYDTKAKVSKIFATCYNSNTGEKSSDNILIFSVPVEKKNRSEFYVFVSRNKKFLLINHSAYFKVKKEFKDEYLLLNQNLDIVAEKTETINKDELDYKTYNFIVDNDGSFYYVKSYNNGEHFIVSYDARKNYEKWEEKIDLSDLNNKAKYSNIKFSISPKNDLIISGYYTIDDKELEGCFFMKIDNFSKEVVINKVNIFEKSFKEEFLSLRENKKKKEGEIPNLFNHVRLLNKEDGGIVLIGEKYTHTIYQGNFKITHVFTYEDLVVLNFSPAGELFWAKRIPKKQYYKGDGTFQSIERISKKTEYFSYLAGMDKENLYIYFNEHPKNLNNPKKLIYLHKVDDAVPLKFSLNLENGEVKSEIMKDLGQSSVFFKPMSSFQKEQNADVIIIAQFRKKFKLGTFNFN